MLDKSNETAQVKINTPYGDVDRVQQFVYVAYVCTPTFISVCMIFDIVMLTCVLIFSL